MGKIRYFILFLGILFCISINCIGQQTDTLVFIDTTDIIEEDVKYDPSHSPQKAAMYSAVFPGLGQAYNKQYWKIPILYAGTATVIYFIVKYSRDYNLYYKAYADYHDGNKNTESYKDLYFWDYTYIDNVGSLKTLKDNSRRWRDLDYIILAGIYFLNIIDANVSAHLKYFDVSDDLSFNISPALNQNIDYTKAIGLKINITF